MPVSFIIFIVFAVIAAIATAVIRLVPPPPDGLGKAGKITAVSILWCIVLIPLIFASLTIVSTKNVGVTTTFGKPVGTLSNGLHIKAPWQKVTELDGAIQIDNRTGDKATSVRLGNNSTAGVDNSVRWRIVPAAADELFRDYRTFDAIRDNLVIRELNASLNQVMAGYDPLNSTKQADGGADLNRLGGAVTEDLRSRVGDRVEILSVIVPYINFDDQTEEKINRYQGEVANTRIAEQKQKTAAAEAEANRILSQSVNNDPNVLVSKCLDIAKSTSQPVLGCWPGVGVQPTVAAR